jgi:putative transposase
MLGKSGRRVVLAFIGTAFAQETPEAAKTRWRAVADHIPPQGAQTRRLDG